STWPRPCARLSMRTVLQISIDPTAPPELARPASTHGKAGAPRGRNAQRSFREPGSDTRCPISWHNGDSSRPVVNRPLRACWRWYSHIRASTSGVGGLIAVIGLLISRPTSSRLSAADAPPDLGVTIAENWLRPRYSVRTG